MRILHIPENDVPASRVAASMPIPEAAPVVVQDNGRVDALEKIAASILQKLNAIDDRVTTLETAPAIPAPAIVQETPRPAAAPAITPVSLDADAIKKGLMTKMWTYLNDKAA